MPELSKSNFEDAIYTKFIRKGGKIYFSVNRKQDHIDIADEYIPGEYADDAGFLEKEEGKLVATGGSSTLWISEHNEGREETNNQLSNLQ